MDIILKKAVVVHIVCVFFGNIPSFISILCVGINCFSANIAILSLVHMVLDEEDDSASGCNLQTMGLVRIKQLCFF